jgi:hypothetical protein
LCEFGDCVNSGRRALLLIVAGVTFWYVCSLAVWAFQPLQDSVPVGVDYTLAQPREVSVSVECNTLFASAARDSSPLPALNPQPVRSPPLPPLEYRRDACTSVHSQARKLLMADTALVALTLAFGGWLWRRTRRVAAPATQLASA